MGMGLVITLITIITVYNNLLVFNRQLRKFKSFLGHNSKKKDLSQKSLDTPPALLLLQHWKDLTEPQNKGIIALLYWSSQIKWAKFCNEKQDKI